MNKYKIPVCCEKEYYKLIEEIGKNNGMTNTSQALEKIIRSTLNNK